MGLLTTDASMILQRNVLPKVWKRLAKGWSKIVERPREGMEFAIYSIALIAGYAATRYGTEQTKFHIRVKGLWIHHWIIAALLMVAFYWFSISEPWLWGGLTGAAVEGLTRKNWSIRNSKKK